MRQYIEKLLMVALSLLLVIGMVRGFIGHHSTASLMLLLSLITMMNSIRMREQNKARSYVYFSCSLALAIVALVLFK
ncbi:hypothetical protein [Anoxybacillus sp. J5B_2022]|uniref:hypothetical protein n=1 Tax=Anoxybacillus sp. J5B_2022 TaxID=3003246 RepID=UPI00228558CC|nr:hypothetical protein [Anoxybacillus sp. J5B_2022]MCZ0753981.1 hypothetical protein [Anoxybacillus sp. J5B_2022]